MKIDIEDVRRLNVHAGDTVMFRLDPEGTTYLSADEVERMRDEITRRLPNGVNALVVVGEVAVEVIGEKRCQIAAEMTGDPAALADAARATASAIARDIR